MKILEDESSIHIHTCGTEMWLSLSYCYIYHRDSSLYTRMTSMRHHHMQIGRIKVGLDYFADALQSVYESMTQMTQVTYRTQA